MRNKLYLLFFLLPAALASCRKDQVQQSIKEYDDEQIRNYITANGLSNMKRETTGGDTSGIYYEILGQGTGPAVDASTLISTTFSVKALDGSYSAVDTLINHTYTTLGQYNYLNALAPAGVQLALTNLVKRQGTRLHLLIPSRLAYGRNGALINSSVRIGGNKSLDVYINVINNTAVDAQGNRYNNTIDNYDDISIQKYIAANSLTGFTPIKITTPGPANGITYYYKVRTPGTGTIQLSSSSLVAFDYRSTLLNGIVVAQTSDAYALSNPGNPNNQTIALREALLQAKITGTEFTIIAPSRIVYGLTGSSTYPAHSCVMYDVTLQTITN